ncbi:MAG: methyl-accepting chemotaxis protein [Desulfocapsaceae bacterium]|nr:methyl-accepting chemotaxis protein [Desulfocapsaceae bacterium]
MVWFVNMKISMKLMVVALISSLSLVGLGGYSYSKIKEVFTAADFGNTNVIPSVLILSHLLNHSTRYYSLALRHVINTDASAMSEIEEKLKQNLNEAYKDIAEYEKFIADDTDRRLWAEDSATLEKTITVVNEIIPLSQAGKNDAAREIANTKGTRVREALDKAINDHLEYNFKLSDASSKTADSIYSATRLEFLFAILAIMLILGSVITLITRAIVGPVFRAVAMAESMAKGDFSARIDLDHKDEIGVMIKSLNTMSDSVGAMVKDIILGVENLGDSSSQMSSISQQLTASAVGTAEKTTAVAAAAEEMSTNIQSVAASMEQSASNVSMVAAATEEMSATIGEIGQNAEKARAVSESAVRQSQVTTAKVTELGESARKVGRVTETITEISEQTNLLALNATIEAARAGEAGKGFAVVANEIKELARQTAAATVEIKSQIDEMQNTTNSTITDIENISEVIVEINGVINGIATAVEEQSTATNEISSNISQASEGIAEVNENVAQSTMAVTEITQNIQRISQDTIQAGEGSKQVQICAGGLSDLSVQLQKMVGKFKV